MNGLREALTPLAARMPRVVREHEILRVVGVLKSREDQQTNATARKEILAWLQKRSGGRLPKEAWECKRFEYLSGGRNSVGVRIATPEIDLWSVRADDPDKNIPGRTWTTEVTVGGTSGELPTFTARLIVSTTENDFVDGSQGAAVPGFVKQLATKLGVQRDGYHFSPDPRLIDSEEDSEWLINTLLDPSRHIPVFILSVPNNAEHQTAPLLDANNLSKATIGIGIVAITTPKSSWALTHRFGKQRSVFNGAARTYLPGFSDDSDPYSHKLALADQLATPKGKTDCLRLMRNLAAAESLRHTRLGKDVLAFSAIRNASIQINQKNLEEFGASSDIKLDAATTRIRALEERVESLEKDNEHYLDEYLKEYQRAEDADKRSFSLTFRIQQLNKQIKDSGAVPDTNITFPKQWRDFGDWCDQHLAGRVVLASAARRAVQEPEYNDIELAARCLLWLANDYRESRLGQSDLRVREAPIESGVRNAACGSDEYEINWNGQRHVVDWHIKNGGNTRNPSRCLRIYHLWDPASQQVIVADMPAHRRTGAT